MDAELHNRAGRSPSVSQQGRALGPYLVAAMAGATIAAVWLAIVLRLNEHERHAFHDAERNLANLALAFDEGLAYSIKGIDQAMVAVRSEFIRAGLTPEVRRLTQVMGEADPLLISFGIADAKGDVIFPPSAGSNATGPVNAADRPYFNAHLEPGTDQLHISPPSVGRLSGKWGVVLSRRITLADGSFGGVVIATIDAVKLGDFYTKIDLGPQGVIAVIGLDGIARVRIDGMARARFGDDLSAQPAVKRAASAPAGSYRFVAIIDGQERVFSYRAMQGVPLIVFVGAAVADILREPSEYAQNAYLLGGAITLAILIIAGLIQLQWHRATQRERELERQSALLQTIFESLNDGISVLDKDRRLVAWNKWFATQNGIEPSAVYAGATIRDLLVSQARSGEFGACDPEAEADRQIETLWPNRPMVWERTRPNGHTIELRRSPTPGGGRVTVYIDITQRKAAERELGEYRRLLSTVLATTRQGFWFTDTEPRTTDVNPAMCAILGRAREDIVGKNAFDFVDEKNAAIIRREFERRKRGVTDPYEVALKRPDGTQIPCIVAPAPLYDEDGRLTGTVGIWTDISELVKARDTIESKNRVLAAMFKAIPDAATVIGPDLRGVELNDQHYVLFDIDKAAAEASGDVVKFTLLELARRGEYGPGDSELLVKKRMNDIALRIATQGSFEYQRQLKNGRWIEARLRVIEGGGWITLHRDITDLKAATQELERQAALLQTMLASLSEGISVFDKDGRLVAWNKQFADYIGADTALLYVGAMQREIILSQARSGEFGVCDPEGEADRRVATLWPDSPRIWERTRPNGRTIELRRSPTPDGGHVTVYIDITERKANERALHDFRHLLSTVLATTREGFWFIDTEARTTDVNPAMCAILDRSRDDILGRDIYAFVDANNAEIFRRQLELRSRGGTDPYEIALSRPNGSHVLCINNPAPLFDQDGRRVGLVGIWTDVTELKNAERALSELNATLEQRVQERTMALAESERRLMVAEAKREAERLTERLRSERDIAIGANRAKSQFLASMSHELRSPLNAIIGFSEVTARELFGPISNQRYVGYARDINSGAKHLLEIIEDLLDMSRIELDRHEIKPAETRLGEIVQESVVMTSHMAQQNNLEIDSTGIHANQILLVDKRAVKQVLVNLLSNSVKFTGRGGKIAISSNIDASGAMRIAVSDTGTGIAADKLSIVFEAFVTDDATRARAGGGAGLGLWISRALMRLHGGDLTLESVVDQGTTATAVFPPTCVVAASDSTPS